MLGKSVLALLLLYVGLSKDHLGLLTAWWLVAKREHPRERGNGSCQLLKAGAWKLAVFILPCSIGPAAAEPRFQGEKMLAPPSYLSMGR